MTDRQRAACIEKMRSFIISQGAKIVWCPVPEYDSKVLYCDTDSVITHSEILILSPYAGYVVPGTLMEAIPPQAHKSKLPFSAYCPNLNAAFRDPLTMQHTVVCAPDHIEKGQINFQLRDLMVFEPMDGEHCTRKLIIQHRLITPIKRFVKHWVCYDYKKMVAYDKDMKPLGCFAMIQAR